MLAPKTHSIAFYIPVNFIVDLFSARGMFAGNDYCFIKIVYQKFLNFLWWKILFQIKKLNFNTKSFQSEIPAIRKCYINSNTKALYQSFRSN